MSASKKDQFKVVKDLLTKADTIIVATDSGREGSNIAWSIMSQAQIDVKKKTIKRLWLNSLEKDAIITGFKNLGDHMQHFSHHYQSDISRQQFDLIRQDLEASRKRTHPKHIDPYDIFCAMLYVLKNGCTWRNLPADYPKWSTVYYYWMSWSKVPTPDKPALLTQVLKKLSLIDD